MPTDPEWAAPRTRRRVLQAAGSAAVAALAGCASGDGDGTATQRPTAAPTATTTASTETASRQTTVDRAAQRETAVTLVTALGNGDYESAFGLLSERVRGQYSVDRLRSDWEAVTGTFGEFRSVAGVDRTTAQGYDVLVVSAQFESGVVRVQVAFRGAAVEGLQFLPPEGAYSPPAYADADAFSERELTLDTGCGLGATLSEPDGGADVGVVLVHGSGPNDRDETVGPNKPLRDLAWGLASDGAAVLRYDKRTYACEAATDELGFDALVVDDALAALGRLREETGVSSAAVVGHSLGAYAAPRIADRDGDAAAFLLAAPSRPLYELVPDQVRYLATLDGTVTDAERERIEETEATAERLASGDYGDGGFSWGAQFWRDVADYDPVAAATGLDAAVYALQGGRDYQVSPSEDFPAWRDALPEGRAVLYDDLNHLFVAGDGDPTPSEYVRPGNVAESVVADLAGWLTE